MIPKSDWTEYNDEYLQRAQLSEYADCKTTLTGLGQAIDSRYRETNNNFLAGSNAYLTFRANSTFHVSTPKLEETDSLPLSGIFPDRKYIPLLEALATVDTATDLLEEFEHCFEHCMEDVLDIYSIPYNPLISSLAIFPGTVRPEERA